MGGLGTNLPSAAPLQAAWARLCGLLQEKNALEAARAALKRRQRWLAQLRGVYYNGNLPEVRRRLLLWRERDPLAARVLNHLNPASPEFSLTAAEELLAAEKASVEYLLYTRPVELEAAIKEAETEFQSLQAEVACQLPTVASVLAVLEQEAVGYARAIKSARACSSKKEEEQAEKDFACAARRWAAELAGLRKVWEWTGLPDEQESFTPRDFPALSFLLELRHLSSMQGRVLLRLVEERLSHYGKAASH